MFLPVNMSEFCKQYFNFYCNGIFRSSHSRVFLKIFIRFQAYLRNSREGLTSSRAAGCISPNLMEVGSFMGVSQVFCLFYYLLCEWLFCRNCPQWLLHNFQHTFHFNLTWKECFQEGTLRGCIFDKYLVLYQFFIKHSLCIGNLERFPSQMKKLLMQYLLIYNFYNIGFLSRWFFDSVMLAFSFIFSFHLINFQFLLCM